MKLILRSAFVAAMLFLGAAFSVVSAAPVPQPGAATPSCSGGASLSGWYGMLVGSYSGTGGKYLTGAVHFDGACGLTGTNTFGGVNQQFAHASVTGTYGGNADGTISITMNLAGQSTPQTYIVGVSQSENEAVGIETDGTSAFIDLQSQLTTLTSGFNTASLTGTYSASCSGSGVDLNYATFDGKGNITGVDDEENNGVVTTNTPYTGSYAVNSDGTFQGSVLFNGSQIPFYGVLDNGTNEIEYIYTGVNFCVGKKSTTANLSGSYGILVNGSSANTGGFLSGSINFNGSGALSGEVNGDFDGQYGNAQVSGSYTVNSNNTIAITMNLTGQSTPQTYGVGVSESGNEAIGIETDGTKAATVDMQSQLTSQPYSTSSLHGTYAVVCSNIGLVALNYVTFDGQGNIASSALAYSDGGAYGGDSTYTGTYTVNTDGTFAGALAGGFAQYSFTGVIGNATAEIEYSYEVAGVGNQACSGVSTYGPIGTAPVAAIPTFSPAPGNYGSAQSVTLSDTTAGAVIHYTANGTPPTPNSPVYSAPVPVSATTSIQAIAVVAPGYNNSAIGSGTYYVTALPTVAAPTFSPAPGNYSSTQSVTLSDTTPGAVIYYTTDGTIPTTNSPVYGAPVPVSATTTIEAIAVASGYNNSAVGIGVYTITLTAATPTFSPAPGTYSSTQIVTLSDTTSGAVIHCTTNGTMPTSSSPACTTVSVSATTTIEAIAVATGYNNSAVAAGVYTIAPSSTVVNLGSYYNVYAITSQGSWPNSGGIDGFSYNTYNSSTVGTSAGYQGLVFSFGPANVADAVNNKTVTVSGQYGQLYLLGTGVDGAQLNQTLTVTYTDGTSSTFTQSFSDWGSAQNYAGETVITQASNRIGPFGFVYNFATNLYGYTFSLSAGKTVASVKLPSDRNVVILGVGLGNASGGSGNGLPAAYNVYGIATSGTAPKNGGFDNDGYAYNSSLLGTSLSYQGLVFSLGPANALDAASNDTVTVSAGQYSQLYLLGAGVNGSQTNQTVTAYYTDGSSSTFTQSFSDWAHSQKYSGETVVAAAASRIGPGGVVNNLAVNVYGYTFALTAGKSLSSVKLPSNRNVVVVAMGLSGAAVSTAIVPYLQVNGGSWQQTATTSVTSGSSVNLGPQPVSGGSWSWTGPSGYTSTSRQINNIPLSAGANTFVATYTNSSGVQSTQVFTITVNGTPTSIVPYLQVNGGSWQQTASTTVSWGAAVNLGPQPLSGGSWSWTGPNGYTSSSRQINNIPLSWGTNTFVATYTNSSGVQSTQTFAITVTWSDDRDEDEYEQHPGNWFDNNTSH
jgi:Chitobiase/beta-hexosaminidase C-terminal domain